MVVKNPIFVSKKLSPLHFTPYTLHCSSAANQHIFLCGSVEKWIFPRFFRHLFAYLQKLLYLCGLFSIRGILGNCR